MQLPGVTQADVEVLDNGIESTYDRLLHMKQQLDAMGAAFKAKFELGEETNDLRVMKAAQSSIIEIYDQLNKIYELELKYALAIKSQQQQEMGTVPPEIEALIQRIAETAGEVSEDHDDTA
jgi:hypothetical protein